MSPVRTDACKRGSPGKAKREAGAGKEISLPSTFRLKTTTAEMASLRPATMAGRPRRSAGSTRTFALQRLVAIATLRACQGIARRQLAGGRRPWAAALQQQGSEAAEVGAVAGVLALFPAGLDAERQVALARADAGLGCEPAALFRRLGGGTAEQGVGVGFQQGTGVFVSGIVDGAGHGGTSWRLRPCGPCPLGRSPAPTVQSISPSAPPLDCLEPSPAAPVLTGTTPDTTRRRECPARLPINCSNA